MGGGVYQPRSAYTPPPSWIRLSVDFARLRLAAARPLPRALADDPDDGRCPSSTRILLAGARVLAAAGAGRRGCPVRWARLRPAGRGARRSLSRAPRGRRRAALPRDAPAERRVALLERRRPAPRLRDGSPRRRRS